jgi:hypothetical protein
MNKFWLAFAALTLSISTWLYARGYERFSEDSFNRGLGGDRPQELRPQDFRQDNAHFDKPEDRALDNNRRMDYGTGADNRSDFEKAENQGALRQAAQKYQQPQALNLNHQADITPTQVGSQVRQNFPASSNWFRGNFYQDHGLYNTPAVDAWRASNWADANGWLGAGWGQALDYDPNGSSVEVSQPGSSSYTATGQDAYMNQPSASSANPPPVADNNTVAENNSSNSWIPLGIYALGTDTIEPSDTNLFLQLAMNKDGQLAGAYYNATTNKAESLTGSVDKSTQMASFYIADRPDSPIVSTGIYNLTQPQTAVNVIMPDTSQRTWSMVKINNS